MYGINLLFGLITLVALIVAFIPVTYLPALSAISFLVPALISIHVAFVLFWFVRKKRYMLLSGALVVIWYMLLGTFYRFSGPSNADADSEKSLSVMSFNSRRFNEHRQLDRDNVDSLILDFVTEKDPDILCFQECYYLMKRNGALGQYKYRYVDYEWGKPAKRVIQAIYSKYPIIKKDSILFPKSSNSAIYADIQYGNDTLRIYNVHLQSFSIIPEFDAITNQKSSKLLARSKQVMLKQHEQVNLVKESMRQNPYKKIVVGDFNNTQYSNVYQTIKGEMTDTFLEKGSSFGRTYNLLGFPMRIDYILADPSIEVVSHKNFNEKLSDHYPVMAILRIKEDH
ncbi:endonuclease/exonuclease/phosphatase family protein [Flagellimonas myxillae]|uniref:endonuclease/exonuclease/phosphatase family protein n=1 Tax=Flagellimonas myxillae TaxID=2942214 RepID=UPI00201F463B|nr:endonuclease/exonuclease/phosphatase family protein [Muricauda myxillae]MCL6265383.1 endonuclease/exonuclease/phosphatase family protein [Muricauda myxillae]